MVGEGGEVEGCEKTAEETDGDLFEMKPWGEL